MQETDTRPIIKAALEKAWKALFSRNTIDKLMRDKVEDYILLEELPLPIRIGEKTIYIGNFTLQNEYTFFRDYAKMMAAVGMRHLTMELFTGGAFSLYKHIMVNKKMFKRLLKLIGKTILKHQRYYHEATSKMYALPKCSLRYFLKYVTKEKLFQIMHMIYIFNWDGEKKNFTILAEASGAKAATENYMYSWLVNLTGATGAFLTHQSPNVDSLFAESASDIPEPQEKNNG